MRVIRAEIQSIDGSLGKKPDIPRVPSALLLGTCCSTDLEPETPYGSGVQNDILHAGIKVEMERRENQAPCIGMQ
jgi:hypothetical protein